MTYRTLYFDKDGSVFVGDEWPEDVTLEAGLESEKKVLDEIEMIESINVVEVKEVINRRG